MFTTSTGKLQPVWAFVFSTILSILAFVVAGNIATEVVGHRVFLFELVFRPLLALLLIGIFIWLLTVGDQVEDHRLAAQGLPRVQGWLKHFVIGCVIGFALTVLAVAPIHFWGHAKLRFDFSPHILPKVGAVLVMLLCGALAEELMFRGYPFQHLEQGIGSLGAVVVFSVFYGALHLLNPSVSRWGIANTVLIGILLAIAYLRTRALWLPWGIHFGWNATLGFLFGLPVSGFRFFNVITHTTVTGPTWVTGGNYGVEASAAAAGAIAVGALLVWQLPLRKLRQPTRLAAPSNQALQHTASSSKP